MSGIAFGEDVHAISADEFRKLAGKPSARKCSTARSGMTPLSALPFRVSLPFLPPSVNKLFATVQRQGTSPIRVLTRDARQLRKMICALTRGQLENTKLYELHVDVFMPAFTRDGALRRVDLSNRIKFLEDCLCSALGIDDRQFFRVVLTKHHAERPQTDITIIPYHEAA